MACSRRLRANAYTIMSLTLLSAASAHLTTVCTVSSFSENGKVHFMLGTYHSSINNQGDIRIVQPNGAELSFPLNDDCDPSVSPSIRGQATETHITASASCGFPADAQASCYTGKPGSKPKSLSTSHPHPTLTPPGEPGPESGSLSNPRRTKAVTGNGIHRLHD